MFLVSFSVTFVPITHKIRTKEFAHPNAILQKTQGKYTCMVHWVGHVFKQCYRITPYTKVECRGLTQNVTSVFEAENSS